jgi:hypothetical protein
MTHMRRSSVVVAGTVSVTVILAVSLSVAASAPGQRNQSVVHHAKAETLKLTLKDAVETEVDVNKDGIGAGDYVVQTGSVYLGTKKLGRFTQSTTALTVKPVPSLRFSLDLVLPRGQVTLQGSFTLADPAPQLAVTGGTGKYEGVRGQLTETGSVGDANLVTLHLLHP